MLLGKIYRCLGEIGRSHEYPGIGPVMHGHHTNEGLNIR